MDWLSCSCRDGSTGEQKLAANYVWQRVYLFRLRWLADEFTCSRDSLAQARVIDYSDVIGLIELQGDVRNETEFQRVLALRDQVTR
jgi:hypothetical protein